MRALDAMVMLPDGQVEGVRRRTAGTTELCRSLLRTALSSAASSGCRTLLR
ncbi:hypothetical protein [Kribbella endophytica]